MDGRTIKYNIPNTVPGEYVETRILFPENVVKDTPITDPENYLDTVLEEEKEYSESDKSNLLKARRMQLKRRVKERERNTAKSEVFS